MTAIDTNVIVRYLVGDHAEQAEAARTLMFGLTPGNPGFICREVVIEIAWVLERSYGFAPTQIAEALMDLTASDTLVVENSDDVAKAAHRYQQGGAGFSDLNDSLGSRTSRGHSPPHLRSQTCPDGGRGPGRAWPRRRFAMKDSHQA